MAKLALEDQHFETIKSYCLNPNAENLPLTKEQAEVLDRWISASKLLEKYPIQRHAIQLHLIKHPNISKAQAHDDMRQAMRLFNSLQTFNYEWWHTWLINDVVKQIEASKLAGDLKSWAEGHKNLIKALGEKPETELDPKLTEKHTFIIPIKIKNSTYTLNWNSFQKIPEHIRREIVEAKIVEINDEDAKKIMET
jgi:hypothetical protein